MTAVKILIAVHGHRRRFDAALAESPRLEEQRLSATVGELIRALPFPPEVRRGRARRSDAAPVEDLA